MTYILFNIAFLKTLSTQFFEYGVATIAFLIFFMIADIAMIKFKEFKTMQNQILSSSLYNS